MREITAQEYKAQIDAGEDIQLIDVREQYEIEIASIGGEHIPLGELIDSVDKISKDKKVIVYCRSGMRAAAAVEILCKDYKLNNVYNLAGGILAYSEEVDSTIPQY